MPDQTDLRKHCASVFGDTPEELEAAAMAEARLVYPNLSLEVIRRYTTRDATLCFDPERERAAGRKLRADVYVQVVDKRDDH